MYCWGFPLVITFRRDQRSLTLRTPESLPALFQFLEVEPIEMPDCRDPRTDWVLHRPREDLLTGRSGASGDNEQHPRRTPGKRKSTSPAHTSISQSLMSANNPRDMPFCGHLWLRICFGPPLRPHPFCI